MYRATGVCMDGHLAASQTTSFQLLMLLLAVVVCDLPTGTVSLCLAIDSALTTVGRSTTLARQLELRNVDSFDRFKLDFLQPY